MKKEIELKNLKSIDFENGMIILNYEDESSREQELIKEAEKRGLKDGVRYVSPNGKFKRVVKYPLYVSCDGSLADEDGQLLFHATTSKWATPIKEPLFTNCYGSEFYEGDKYLFVEKEDLAIYDGNGCLVLPGLRPSEDNDYSEILKDREECLRWIKDNIKRLR